MLVQHSVAISVRSKNGNRIRVESGVSEARIGVVAERQHRQFSGIDSTIGSFLIVSSRIE